MKKFVSIILVAFAILAVVTAPVVIEANQTNDASEPIEFELGQQNYEWGTETNDGPEYLIVEYQGQDRNYGGDWYLVKVIGWDDQKGEQVFTHWSADSKGSAESYVNDWLNTKYYA